MSVSSCVWDSLLFVYVVCASDLYLFVVQCELYVSCTIPYESDVSSAALLFLYSFVVLLLVFCSSSLFGPFSHLLIHSSHVSMDSPVY